MPRVSAVSLASSSAFLAGGSIVPLRFPRSFARRGLSCWEGRKGGLGENLEPAAWGARGIPSFPPVRKRTAQRPHQRALRSTASVWLLSGGCAVSGR
jgi:hypothetical protein